MQKMDLASELSQQSEDIDLLNFSAEFLPNARDLASKVIKNYFSNKKMSIGGPVPKSFFSHPNYVTLVLNTNVEEGIQIAYQALDESDMFDGEATGDPVTEDIRFMLELIHNIEKTVPKVFLAGILLMHLELVEGVSV